MSDDETKRIIEDGVSFERLLVDLGQRRKMSLMAQSDFLRDLLRRCKMHDARMKAKWAGEATLALTFDDMAALACIEKTIGLFDFYDADGHVKRAAQRAAEKKAKR